MRTRPHTLEREAPVPNMDGETEAPLSLPSPPSMQTVMRTRPHTLEREAPVPNMDGETDAPLSLPSPPPNRP